MQAQKYINEASTPLPEGVNLRLASGATIRPEIKALWVSALRSGEYTQGRAALRKGDAFCCLGVACDLYLKTDMPNGVLTCLGERGTYSYGDDTSYLPPIVQEWLRAEDIPAREFPANPAIHITHRSVDGPACMPGCMCTQITTAYSLSVLNDSGFTFEQIADVIDYFF